MSENFLSHYHSLPPSNKKTPPPLVRSFTPTSFALHTLRVLPAQLEQSVFLGLNDLGLLGNVVTQPTSRLSRRGHGFFLVVLDEVALESQLGLVSLVLLPEVVKLALFLLRANLLEALLKNNRGGG